MIMKFPPSIMSMSIPMAQTPLASRNAFIRRLRFLPARMQKGTMQATTTGNLQSVSRLTRGKFRTLPCRFPILMKGMLIQAIRSAQKYWRRPLPGARAESRQSLYAIRIIPFPMARQRTISLLARVKLRLQPYRRAIMRERWSRLSALWPI